MVIALAGRRIDAPDAETKRFPADNAAAVQQKIREFITNNKACAMISAAACGADLLAQEVATEMRLRRRIVLPYDRQAFKQSSVADRPGDWAERYDLLIPEVALQGGLTEFDYEKDQEETFFATNHDILDEAEKIARQMNQKVTALVVWDGHSRGEDDVTGHFLEEAKLRGLQVAEILTI